MTFSAHYRRVRGPEKPIVVLGIRAAILIVFCIVVFAATQLIQPSGSRIWNLLPLPSIFKRGSTYPFTNYERALNKTRLEYWYSIVPAFVCPPKLLSKVGPSNPGAWSSDGKYLCGMNAYNNTAKGCNIYSFSSGNNAEFESDLIQKTSCSVYMYNRVIQNYMITPEILSDKKFHLESLTIGGEEADSRRTLELLMELNGHRWLDVVSIDIPIGSFRAVERILSDFKQVKPFPIGQLIVKFTVRDWMIGGNEKNTGTSVWLLALFKMMEKSGLRLFYNTAANETLSAYSSTLSFINVYTLDNFQQKSLFAKANKK